MKRGLLFFCILLSFAGQLTLQQQMRGPYAELPQPKSATVLPLDFLKVAAGEYRNVLADLFFLRVLNLFGETLERGETNVVGANIKSWEWRVMAEELDLVASLEPLYLDPYYFANAILTHHKPLVPDVIELLKRGTEARDWDWELPFYAGFNYFYYLNRSREASHYLMIAAKRPSNKGSLMATLAARLAYQGHRTETAILFLRQMLASASDPTVKKTYENRLQSLEGIDILEKAVGLYRQRYGRAPKKLTMLVSDRILKRLPVDPYGGDYFIAEDGRIKTTSEFRPVEK